MKNITGFVCAGIFLLSACVSDKAKDVKPEIPVAAKPAAGVYITNEGNFTWGNASVSYYNFSDQQVTEDAFKAVNNRQLGDVCQSMSIINGKAYIVVNNSFKIEVVTPDSLKSVGVISGLSSPRYILAVGENKAYVTDYKRNAIYVVDLSTNNVIKEIPCKGWTEELVLAANKVFVTNVRKQYLYIVNPASDIIEDSIKIGLNAYSIKTDKNNKVWVLAGKNGSVAAKLHKINPITNAIEQSYSFNASDNPGSLEINGTKDTLYYLNKGVCQLSISDVSLPNAVLIPQGNMLFYGLGIDPASGVIYVSNAIDYVQQGIVYRHLSNGTLLNSFKVGTTPGDFCFY
ncbi:YncE family protein [Sporocytophaga myxococcoides]|uniref:YncE family protein n=1 Tax=Sporocytophaga myxococcoides TaxID=153721 RepID=UPI0003F685F0|nr:DUF5074 domain-containing protein [Sporocytophaga myxococcoides]